MKILVVGNDINSILLAQYIKLQNREHDIYLTSDDSENREYYTSIKILENDIQSIGDFVKYNQIEFTIVTSQLAIINGIADMFKQEGFPIFAPLSEAARITFFNSIAKKIMYKLKINTPKFGIFDRENLATEYIRHSKFPIIIGNDFTLMERKSEKYQTFSKAKLALQKIFENGNEKIIIENYIDTKPIYIYFITDGYNALPLISIEREEEKIYTSFYAQSSKISDDDLVNILKRAIYPLIDDISKYAGNYTGIIGIKLKLYHNSFCILEFYNNFQEYDFQVFLSLLNDNLLELLYDTANGCLADNHNCVNMISDFSYTMAVNKEDISELHADTDFINSIYKNKIILTNTASTQNHAKKILREYVNSIAGMELKQTIKEADNRCAIRI